MKIERGFRELVIRTKSKLLAKNWEIDFASLMS